VKRPKVTPDGIRLSFSAAEAEMLSTLAGQVAELLDGADDQTGDPALERLLPDGYRDSPDDADEFRRFTQSELVDEKVASAESIVASLTERTTAGAVQVLLTQPEAVTWLRSLNDIRLALAARLGIVDENYRPDLTDNTFAIYVWLGQVQFALLRAVDR
jgi:hypothetical protein